MSDHGFCHEVHRFPSPLTGHRGFVLRMWYNGRGSVAYSLRRAGETESLFEGDTYRPALGWGDQLGRRSALGLMMYLTLRPGDTDDEYFDDYTDAQAEWAASFECEALACDISRLEEWHDRRR